jgi:hypothetical protein
VNEVEMGISCSTHGGEEEFIKNFGRIARRKETTRKS